MKRSWSPIPSVMSYSCGSRRRLRPRASSPPTWERCVHGHRASDRCCRSRCHGTSAKFLPRIPALLSRISSRARCLARMSSRPRIGWGHGLGEWIGQRTAAIHALPPGFVIESGLPQHRATNARSTVIELIGRAADTGRIPAALIRRWEEATDDAMLWHFHETVVNGTLSADSILVYGHTVVGVVGWSGLSVDDPARDLHWLMTSSGTATEHALTTYLAARGGDV